MPYPFSPEIEKELRAFDGDAVEEVADEIRICKLLIRRAVEEGKSGLANGLLSTIAKLSSAHVTNQVRVGELLERAAVVAIAQQLSGAIAARLANVPNRDDLLDALTADFAEIFRRRGQPLQLTHEPATCVDAGSSESRPLPLGRLEGEF